jgi:hypothetical protein
MNVLGIVLLAIFTIIFVVGIFQTVYGWEFEEGAYTYACQGSDLHYTCFRVYYASMERQEMIDYCELGNEILGCHKIIYSMDLFPVHTVALEKGKEFATTLAGCTVFEHELLHAWGYHEQMISQFFPCDRTSIFVNATLPHTGFWK